MDLSAIVRDVARGAGSDPNLIVGFDTGDDAGVYRISDDLALVQTVDYITPVVDDPYLFGQVAAANALSDVYAMGGRPLTALNICNFPSHRVDVGSLRRILEGGFSKIREAGAVLVGGHSVRDDELKYGLAVTGLVDPRRLLTNAGARPGDVVLLTKPIGTGVIVNGFRRGAAPEDLLLRAAAHMATLNHAAAEALLEHGARACTDVTGFGLLGHAMGLARQSRVLLRLRFADLPRYDESLDLIARGVTTAMTIPNLQAVEKDLTWTGAFRAEERALLADPQTSGGLLASVPPERAADLLARLRARGVAAAALVGEVVAPPGGRPGLEVLR